MNKMLYALLFILSTSGSSYAAGKTIDSLKNLSVPSVKETQGVSVVPAIPVPQATVVPADKSVDKGEKYFNAYILKAVEQLNTKYGLLGYDIHSTLTHNLTYNKDGVISATNAPKTMCVAAQLEVILTALEIYTKETGDYSPYYYLPKSSYEKLSVNDIKGHIWVNSKFKSYGTADALINFGMGERATFDNLKPGAFINLNRTNRTGHAVTFLGYINAKGEVLPSYNKNVVGFKYFSSQGLAAAGKGGFDYRYAVFSNYGCPENMPGKRDCNVMMSPKQMYLNTGTMLSPKHWQKPPVKANKSMVLALGESTIDESYFNGLTTDDQ